MGYNPKFVFGKTTVQAISIATGELSVIAINDFSDTDTVQFFDCLATFLNGPYFPLDSAGPLIFTATIVHADVSSQSDSGKVGRVMLPTYPPTNKAFANELDAIRHDSVSGDGHRQVVLERVEEFLPLTFENVPWADMPAWTNFFRYALKGGSFDYYPDRDSSSFQTWVLDDISFKPTFNARGLSRFNMRMRLFV